MKLGIRLMAAAIFCMATAVQPQEPKQSLSLLPERLGPMESVFWGRNGTMRKVFDFPLTLEGRENELNLRRNMLGLHQLGGLVTLAAMAATVVLGQKVYNGETDLSQIHKAMAWTTVGTYSATAVLAVFTPPPLVRRREWSTVSTHKFLAAIHLTGMVMTPFLGTLLADGDEELRLIHLSSAYATTAAFGAAMLVVTF